jgi:hypothetical protein
MPEFMPRAKVPKILGVGRFKPYHIEWRLGAPLRAVHEAGLAITETIAWHDVVTHDGGLQVMVDAAFASNLVIFQAPHNDSSLPFMQSLQEAGIKVAVDHDDHPFLMKPDNLAYKVWGTKECAVKLGGRIVKQWVDCGDCEKCRGKKPPETEDDLCFNIKRNRAAKRRWLQCVRAADALIVTNARLRERMQRFKGWRLDTPVHTTPNLLDMDNWSRIQRPRRPSPYIRIGWHGGWSHHADLMMIRPTLLYITRAYPNVKLVFFGFVMPDVIEGIPPEQLEIHDWEDGVTGFMSRLKSSQIDIGLCPVVPGEFAVCKTELKWVEYASQGIPVVATHAEPYESAIEFGADNEKWTGVLALTNEEWIAALTHYIENPAMRRTIGENAYRRILERYDARKRAPEIMKVYQEILDDVPDPVRGHREVARALVE